jgi:hypothetical protein
MLWIFCLICFLGKEEVGQVKIRALYAMWCGYLQTLSSIKLLDKDGEISKDVTTHITKEEAKKLMKLLKKLNIFRFSTSPASLGE